MKRVRSYVRKIDTNLARLHYLYRELRMYERYEWSEMTTMHRKKKKVKSEKCRHIRM